MRSCPSALSSVERFIIRRTDCRYRPPCSFNKRQTDFPDLKAYNDYLEEVEDITFNLVNGVDVEDTEARIQRFARENRELIAANSIREVGIARSLASHKPTKRRRHSRLTWNTLCAQANEQRLIGLRGEQEKLEKKLQHEAYLRAIEEEKAMLRAEKEEIISEMVRLPSSLVPWLARLALRPGHLCGYKIAGVLRQVCKGDRAVHHLETV
ncbi:MAG: CDK-activating kinase assembly factor MAT1-domain-containing protein, partial [Olpidium bornovanus]